MPVPAERVVFFEDNAPATGVAPTAGPSRDKAEAVQLSPSETTLFTALCDLHLMAAETDLDLTTKQWAALAAAVVQAQAVRHNYEAQIATARELTPGHFRIEIPPYANAGDELRRQFWADLQRGLGQEATGEVMAQLGRKLEDRFAGFGVSAQTLEITGGAGQALSDVQVARTARYWNSVEGSARATTRREVLFPDNDDPTGARWGALLALVEKSD